jgi:hypothetical protein
MGNRWSVSGHVLHLHEIHIQQVIKIGFHEVVQAMTIYIFRELGFYCVIYNPELDSIEFFDNVSTGTALDLECLLYAIKKHGKNTYCVEQRYISDAIREHMDEWKENGCNLELNVELWQSLIDNTHVTKNTIYYSFRESDNMREMLDQRLLRPGFILPPDLVEQRECNRRVMRNDGIL